MQLKLKNIGMIKEADVNIDGLTVIAGENDTGKSTVGKALYLVLASHQDNRGSLFENQSGYIIKYTKIIELIFNGNITNGNGKITFLDADREFYAEFPDNYQTPVVSGLEPEKYTVSMVETPVVWNFFKFFNAIEKIKTEASFFNQNYEIPYPYLMWDIYRKLSLSVKKAEWGNKNFLLKEIKNVIDGEFIKDDFGDFIYKKGNQKIPVINTATGIKQFGILQKLIENNYIHSKSILILDEPEVHLHPKWQLKMAKLIVELVKNGVKVLVNSHSPYMIEALQRYSRLEGVNSDFYLAENGYIKQIENDNSKTLVEIYEKLSEPYDEFEEMESQRLERLING